jgi:apolipoprotein D and lipocalin family protein
MRVIEVKSIVSIRLLGLVILALAFSGCNSNKNTAKPEVASYVDLDNYLGTWYEIARLPMRFQKNCVGTQAIYSLKEKGEIAVLNRCKEDSLDGEVTDVKGKAWVVDESTNAKLKVQFFWPFKGDYWILRVDPDYQYALVGTPERDNLWILSRNKTLDTETTNSLLATARQQGYDLSELIWTKQLESQTPQTPQ